METTFEERHRSKISILLRHIPLPPAIWNQEDRILSLLRFHPRWRLLFYGAASLVGIPSAMADDLYRVVVLSHSSSVIFDDFQDQATGRGDPAENLDIALIFLGATTHALSMMEVHGIESQSLLRVQRELAKSTTRMAAGQLEELWCRDPPSMDEYQAHLSSKVFPFFSFVSALPALTVGKESLAQVLSDFGHEVGALHQIANDSIGLLSNHGGDLGQRWTWPSIYYCSVADATGVQSLCNNWATENAEWLRSKLLDSGAMHFLTMLSAGHEKNAKAKLRVLTKNKSQGKPLWELLDLFRLRFADVL